MVGKFVLPISAGGGSVVETVRATFIDYDGTILKEEYGPVGFTPTPPDDPEGDDIRIFSTWIGDQENITTDTVIGAAYWFGADLDTYLFLRLTSVTGLTITFRCYMAAGTANITWGDGTSENTSAGAGNKIITHTYPATGDYRIKVASLYSNGENYLGTSSSSVIDIPTALYKAYIGWPTILRQYSFYTALSTYYNDNLASVCLSNVGTAVTSTSSIGGFRGCSIKALVVPQSYMISGIMNAFYGCKSLKYFIMPSGMLAGYIYATTAAFYLCEALEYVRLPDLTGLAASFFQQSGIKKFIANSSFRNINSSSMFFNCQGLETVILNQEITTLSSSMFYGCISLKKLDIPDTVTSMSTNTITNCWSLDSLIMRGSSPPTIDATSGIGARKVISLTLKIYVPLEAVDTYKAASGWSIYADIIYAISE